VPVIEARGLTRTYRRDHRRVEALRGIDLTVAGGERLVVMGPSGGGKSTLLNLLGGLDRADAGSLTVAGTDLGAATERALDTFRRRHVGFVFQFFNLLGTVDARDNVALALLARGTPWRAAQDAAGTLLTELGLGDRADHRPSELSGGEQQRVAIARAVAGGPDLLLADEPTGDVDAAATEAILDMLTALNDDRGVTIVLVTHDPAVAEFGDRVLQLRDGSFEPAS
jgi:putative ABC transport system ATP-binding protein